MPRRRLGALATALLCLALAASAGADMKKDSPVTFPEKGALPSKYPPDRPTKDRVATENGYYLFGSPQRSLEQIDRIRAEMPKGAFTPPPQDWKHLARTRRLLAGGGTLHVLGLGDSIVNDTMRSAWLAKLQEAYPKATVRGTVYVRGGGGCQHYREEGRKTRRAGSRLADPRGNHGRSCPAVRVVRRVMSKST